MVNSQNGWPAKPDTSSFTRFTAGGGGWWGANADVAVVLGEFVRRFVAGIEPLGLEPLQCWSYANRLVRGSTKTVSNHGSATAIDLNSLKHPRGVRNTFSKAHRDTMHDIRDSIVDDAGRPVLRLGMDYVNAEPDDMHVEINANADRVKQAADRIRRQQREAEVPTAKEVAAELKPMLKDLIRDEVLKLLKSEPLVPNRATAAAIEDGADPKAPAPLFTLPSALANIETDQDNDRNTNAEHYAAVMTALADVMVKVDDIADKITASAPPPTGK